MRNIENIQKPRWICKFEAKVAAQFVRNESWMPKTEKKYDCEGLVATLSQEITVAQPAQNGHNLVLYREIYSIYWI
jgi:hypothetical protein